MDTFETSGKFLVNVTSGRRIKKIILDIIYVIFMFVFVLEIFVTIRHMAWLDLVYAFA